ncbi:MAG: potassium transporter TrkG [Anaerohalosphaeraceae bacterium]
MKKIKESIEGILAFLGNMHPVRNVVLGYLMYVITGWILLSLPFFHRLGCTAGALDHLFTSTSAVSTTGLATVSIADTYNIWGQFIVMVLIQLGGIGYMTLTSFVVLAQKKPLTKSRIEVANVVFTLPESFKIYKFIKSVIVFTFVIELFGAAALYLVFRNAGLSDPIWSAIFHSVSSFCTAGFGLYNNSFENFSGHFWINMIIAVLSYLGAVGFIVSVDIWRKIRGKIDRVTLTTKIILWSTLYISLTGTLLFFITEPSIQSFSTDKRLLASFFQTMAALTTVGFNSIPIGSVSRASLLLITTLMVIGASPAGTGGGLKCTTFTALWGLAVSTLKGQKDVSFWGRVIPEQRVRLAAASFCFYIVFLLVGVYFLSLTDSATDFEKLLFEAASALGTVGLSTGITASLSVMSKIIIIGLMYAGRIGPLTFGLAMFVNRLSEVNTTKHIDDLVV